MTALVPLWESSLRAIILETREICPTRLGASRIVQEGHSNRWCLFFFQSIGGGHESNGISYNLNTALNIFTDCNDPNYKLFVLVALHCTPNK